MGHVGDIKIWIGSKKKTKTKTKLTTLEVVEKVEACGKGGISKSRSEIVKEFDLEVWGSLLDFCRYCLWICRNTSIGADREENGPV